MYTYSIMPLDIDHLEELSHDIKDQYERGVSTCPLFSMTLVPEGTPVWDKVGPMCEKFAKFRDKLSPHNVPVGVLVQASLGHSYTLVPTSYQKVIGVRDGKTYDVHCPLDKDFIEHFKGVLRRIASEHPKSIMLDDDFRLAMRPSEGCACPLHLAEFERRIGKRYTREQLAEHINTHPNDDPITVAFLDLQSESLVAAAKEFRAAIDEIDPTIQGINCTSGDFCDSVLLTSPIFCGKGNPTIVRVPNGTYAPISTKGFSDIMRRAAVCSTKLRRGGVDIILAETDTIPFNRYGKSARYLHSHYTASILEGLSGAKHWLTRTASFEPASGKAFRDILAEHRYLYEKLDSISRDIKWVGANSMFIEQKHYSYHHESPYSYHPNTWATKVFERMGLPFYFSDVQGGAVFLESTIARDMTDEQIRELFEGSVFMTSEVAAELIRRGYGDLLGVSVHEWTGEFLSGEVYGDKSLTSTKQKNAMEIRIENPNAKAISYSFKRISGEKRHMFPAVTVYERDGGKLSVVYCGTPDANHTYTEGFAFLTETRKRQFISLLSKAGVLPVYYPGDIELCLRAGYLADGRMLVACYDLGFDPLDSLPIYLENAPKKISYLDKCGVEIEVAFEHVGNSVYDIDVRVEPMYPVILIIEQ